MKAAPISVQLRGQVYAADAYQCVYCGYEGDDLTVDHVLPQSRGGQTSFENSLTACRSCNSRKSDRTPGEAGMLPQWGRFYAPSLERALQLNKAFRNLRGYGEREIIQILRDSGLMVSEVAYAYARWRNWDVGHTLHYLIRNYRELLWPRRPVAAPKGRGKKQGGSRWRR